MGGDAAADEAAAQREAIAARMRGEDYAGARTLLLETLQTNPRLDDAFEMLSVLEVLCAAAAAGAGSGPGRGGVDWYKILQVLPRDDADRIDAQYRTIVRQVEPVRDGLPGAEAALLLVNDAYAVLSDPEKRARYDSRVAHVELWRDDILLQTKGVCAADRSAPDDLNRELGKSISLDTYETAVVGFTNNVPLYTRHTDRSCLDVGNCSNVASSSKTKRTDQCFVGDDGGFQLPDENHVDKKQKSVCEKDVHCVSSPHEVLDYRFTDLLDSREDKLCASTQYDINNFENDRGIVNFAAGQIWAAYDWEKLPRRYARINKILTDKEHLYVSWFKPSLQSPEEKKWFSAGLPFVCGTFIAEEYKISVTCPTMFCHQISSEDWNQHIKVYPQQGEVWAIYSDWDIGWCSDPGMRKKSTIYAVEILTSYLKGSGCTVTQLVKVDGYKSVFQRCLSGKEQLLEVHIHNLLMFSHRIPSFRFTCEVGTVFELEHSAVPENLQHENASASADPLSPVRGLHNDSNGFHEAAVTQLSNPSTSKMDLGSPQQGMMNYNSNKLSPEHFVEGQIWAVYDARDRMPRSYVRVIRVVSHTAVSVLKLEPHPMLNEEIRWVEDGLPVACGVLRAGTETTYKEMPEFSHPVECDWSTKRSFYRIFPKKGEIWAMYKNWKITFSSSDIDKCEPCMVEILSDYSDEVGVNVCRLTRVKGFLSFFQRVTVEDFHLTRLISRSEMLSFSHRVPAFVVTEIKERDILKGSWHLEPNALPLRNID